jgi:site-specific recombinase XerD
MLLNATPQPIECLVLPANLTGEKGRNRAQSPDLQQISAKNDLEAIQIWLLEFADSPQTLRTYRKDIERLLLWCIIERQIGISDLTRDDLRDYQIFMADPKPKERWCGQRRSRQHPDWRPFERPLSAHSIAQAITIINALFNYLVEAGYLIGNPLCLMRRQVRRQQHQKDQLSERYLEQGCWQALMNYVEQLPQETARQQTQYERCRYLFHVFYFLGARISEVANHTMASIKQHRGKWWWHVTGKGEKTQRIPLTEPMQEALIRYRHFYDLPALPASDESHALFMNLNGTKSVTDNQIYRLVKHVFNDCADSLADTRPDFADKLCRASPHWLRHTTITHQADAGIDLRHIKRHARHESIETTMLYQHMEDDKWHDAMALYKMPKHENIDV